MMRHRAGCLRSVFFVVLSLSVSCAKKPDTGADPHVTSLGSVEVTATLLEIPGEIRNDPMYDYAHVMQYRVLAVHRGHVGKDVIYVGQYNPAKPRDAAADARAGRIGGNLRQFRAGDVHRMAMEVPIDDHYMGGIINRYFGQTEEPVYWALWTNRAAR